MVCFNTACALLYVCESVRPECYRILSPCALVHIYHRTTKSQPHVLQALGAQYGGSYVWDELPANSNRDAVEKLPSVVIRGVPD